MKSTPTFTESIRGLATGNQVAAARMACRPSTTLRNDDDASDGHASSDGGAGAPGCPVTGPAKQLATHGLPTTDAGAALLEDLRAVSSFGDVCLHVRRFFELSLGTQPSDAVLTSGDAVNWFATASRALPARFVDLARCLLLEASLTAEGAGASELAEELRREAALLEPLCRHAGALKIGQRIARAMFGVSEAA